MKKYEQPEIRIEAFEVEDVITASGDGGNETPFAPIDPAGGNG